jgi:hypothetical protein
MTTIRHFMTLLSTLVIGSVAIAQEIDHVRWQERLLLLIAPSADDPAVVRQKQALRDAGDAVSERRLRVIELYSEPDSADATQLPQEQQRAIRKNLGVASRDRQLILVGLDGGIKRRAPLTTPLREILQQIDGMPMRRQEIEDRKRAGLPVTDP